ncbi:MAG TPA: TonB-dependent receptor [Xanthomonadaceae bacterium]|nr:TonB-dependent receptor [Xanthomonadaceae bacterium]
MNTFPARHRLATALTVLLAAPALVHAAPPAQDAHHDPAVDLDRVVVRATPLTLTAEDLALPVDVLSGDELEAARAATLGDTVNGLPGVQSSWFGPGVGRPILRGMDGPRVRILSDGLGSGDASTTSADHAVSVEPFLADQIEVLKGPATLLYGSGAIGGAVNVIDGRVPTEVTDEPVEGRAELRAGTVDDERTAMARVDATASNGKLVLHADALHRESGDVEIPGFAETDPHPGERPGRLPNSALRTDSAALGASWVTDRGFIGGALSLYSSRYGVPGHAPVEEEAGHDEHGDGEAAEAGHGDVRIVLDQRRGEVRGGIDDIGPFDTLRLKAARTDYTHTEFEGGAVGTVFDNASMEGRLELVHAPLAGWRGALGVQWSTRDFVAIGEEAFVPGSQGRDTGVFWIGERSFPAGDHGRVKLEAGARVDRNAVEVDTAAAGPDRDFDMASASVALHWEANESFHATFGLDRAQRAPTAEALYSDGAHVATGSYERGDPTLDEETATRAELGLHWHGARMRIDGALYRVDFDDFLYLAATGTEIDHLPVRQWQQADARFTGVEAEATLTLADNDSGLWDLRLFGDRVRAQLDSGGDLPRIAPPRVGAGLSWERGPWHAAIDATHTFRQDEVAAGETPTPGYTMLDANIAWHHDTAAGNAWEIFLDASNLLDEEARPHVSFLKDVAPLPGRGIALGLRAFF